MQDPKGPKGSRKSKRAVGAAAAAAGITLASAGSNVGISPDQLSDLKEKFGVNIQLRSNSDAVNSILDKIDAGKAAEKPIRLAGEHDRTYPGYDRDYGKG